MRRDHGHLVVIELLRRDQFFGQPHLIRNHPVERDPVGRIGVRAVGHDVGSPKAAAPSRHAFRPFAERVPEDEVGLVPHREHRT
ncbi:hypothetical protein D3C81_2132760 [compost metagenome]